MRARQWDRSLAEAVENMLHEQRARAQDIIEQYREVVEALAERLLRETTVEGSSVIEMVRRAQRPAQLMMAI